MEGYDKDRTFREREKEALKKNEEQMTAILILNWNGWKDTLECLKSLKTLTTDDFFIMLGDNGSTDDSIQRIKDFCQKESLPLQHLTLGEEEKLQVEKRSIILYDLKENHGFARGNNLLMKYAWTLSPDNYLLLNNDTEVEPDFLSKLTAYQQKHPDVKVLTPLIHYFYDKSLIWNAGGNLIWGLRKYHYADRPASEVTETEFIPCTFITGCALLCTPEALQEDHTLLTERFFHGEEDFDLALRMKKKGVKMGCYVPSVIYHKVGRSVDRMGDKLGATYCYYLNRFVDLRQHLSVLSFWSFVLLYFLYVVRLMHNNGLNYGEAVRFYTEVVKESLTLEGVSKEKYFECVNRKYKKA